MATLLALGAVVPAGHTLFAADRRGRVLAWAVAALIVTGWIAYFGFTRVPVFRIAMEVLSVAAVVAAVLRLRALSRTGAGRSIGVVALARAGRAARELVRSPWILAVKAWLLAMVAFDLAGRAHFAVWEYAVVSCVLTGLIVWRLARSRRASRFGALESYAVGECPGECPLGFGADRAPGAGVERARQ